MTRGAADDDEVVYFETPEAWRRWLERHHARRTALWVGFRKRHTGLPSITWPESVDEALCYGWIDGVRKSIDGDSYKIRFSPRKAGSNWSAVNIARVAELTRLRRMRPAGLAAFERRSEARSRIYSYEQRKQLALDPAYVKKLRADAAAWADFQGRPPSYRTAVTHWVMSAKQAATRERRLAHLITACAAGRLIAPMSYGRK
jgi:uncharacterized protein YdeI (YjbR/CyaY-like superfamily)